MLYAVKHVELPVPSHLDDLLKPAGIIALQYTALTVLDRRDGISSTELAHNSFVGVQSTSCARSTSASSSAGALTRTWSTAADQPHACRTRSCSTSTPTASSWWS